MNRRTFFATISASFLAAKARLFPKPTLNIYELNMEYARLIGQDLADNFFVDGAWQWRMRDYAVHEFRGGVSLREPFIYSPKLRLSFDPRRLPA